MSVGLLDGIRVVELASERLAYAGKLFAEMGADVVLIEPTDGHYTRWFEPFAGDEPNPERSLWWWHYNTGKRSVALDLESDRTDVLRLLASADIVLESATDGELDAPGLSYASLSREHPELIWVTATPFGRDMPRSTDVAVDQTILASGGPVWSCGYDDHSIPPVRGGGNQGYHTGSLWAVVGALAALAHRDAGGGGQRVDVNMNAAANVTTETASYNWLLTQTVVQRQTGRHAAVAPTTPTSAVAADGRVVSTGTPPRTGRDLGVLRDWITELGLAEEFTDFVFLVLGAERDHIDLAKLGLDAEVTAIYGAGRDALTLIAERMPAYEFFVAAQRRGLACGVVNSPEEVLTDPHFIARGFPREVDNPEMGRTVTYPGSAFVGRATNGQIRRAPLLNEQASDVLDAEPTTSL